MELRSRFFLRAKKGSQNYNHARPCATGNRGSRKPDQRVGKKIKRKMNVNVGARALFSAEKIRENPDYDNRKLLFCANPYLWLFATTVEYLTGKEITLNKSYKTVQGRSDAQARDEGFAGSFSEEIRHYALGGQPVPMAENGELVDSLLAFTGITEEQLREAAGKRTEYLQ